ncbi:hypothetical protein J6590_023135 [Homalodisca vitripennis]|nr:hypothetical protein J6590_023135 [Homalodisca vitripennis]
MLVKGIMELAGRHTEHEELRALLLLVINLPRRGALPILEEEKEGSQMNIRA